MKDVLTLNSLFFAVGYDGGAIRGNGSTRLVLGIQSLYYILLLRRVSKDQ